MSQILGRPILRQASTGLCWSGNLPSWYYALLLYKWLWILYMSSKSLVYWVYWGINASATALKNYIQTWKLRPRTLTSLIHFIPWHYTQIMVFVTYLSCGVDRTGGRQHHCFCLHIPPLASVDPDHSSDCHWAKRSKEKHMSHFTTWCRISNYQLIEVRRLTHVHYH